MRIKWVYIIMFLVLSLYLKAQTNLVPNYSFEIYDSCPNWHSELDPCCNNWFSPISKMSILPPPPISTKTWGSSDYFNQCSQTIASCPNNYVGFQNPKSGVAYSGIAVFEYLSAASQFPDYKEYIETKLISRLNKNKKYCFEMSVSVTYFPLSNYYPLDIEVIVTDTLVYRRLSSDGLRAINIYAKPQVKQQLPLIRDTLNWIKVSGSFIAQGGEQYLTIGNFQHTDTLIGKGIYIYIDDVKLWLCDSGDTTSPILPRELKVYPIPSLNNKITVEYVNASLGGMQFCLYNCLGQMVYKYRFASGISKQELSLIHLSSGVYFYSLGSNDAVFEKGKIILLE